MCDGKVTRKYKGIAIYTEYVTCIGNKKVTGIGSKENAETCTRKSSVMGTEIKQKYKLEAEQICELKKEEMEQGELIQGLAE